MRVTPGFGCVRLVGRVVGAEGGAGCHRFREQTAIKLKADPIQRFDCVQCGASVDASQAKPFAIITCAKCGKKLRVPAIFDHFQINRLLGEGGMGAVYEAKDRALHRRVALKVIGDAGPAPDKGKGEKGDGEKGDADADREARRQRIASTIDEARALASLSHKNVVQIYSIGNHRQQPYIVMELVEGGCLDDMIKGGEAMPEVPALGLCLGVAEGLQAASAAGILHGDVKPDNVLISKDGVPKLIDFGISRSEGRLEQPTVLGTPYYISPEMLRGKAADFRADIYSLGAMLFHLVTGQPPFQGDTVKEVLKARLNVPAPDPSLVNPQLHPLTSQLIVRMMQPDPAHRQADYASLLHEMNVAWNEAHAYQTAIAGEPQSWHDMHAAAQATGHGTGHDPAGAMEQLATSPEAAPDSVEAAAQASPSGGTVESPGEQTPRQPVATKKSKTPLIVGAVAGGVALLVIGIALAIGLSGGDGDGTPGGKSNGTGAQTNGGGTKQLADGGNGKGTGTGPNAGHAGGSTNGQSGGDGKTNPPGVPGKEDPAGLWITLTPREVATTRQSFTRIDTQGAVRLPRKPTEGEGLVITGETDLPSLTAVRLELLPDSVMPSNGPGWGVGGTVELTGFKLERVKGEADAEPLPLVPWKVMHDNARSPATLAVDGSDVSAWTMPAAVGRGNVAVFRLQSPIAMEPGTKLRYTLTHRGAGVAGRVRVSISSSLPVWDADHLAAFKPKATTETFSAGGRGLDMFEHQGAVKSVNDLIELDWGKPRVAARFELPYTRSNFALRFAGYLDVDTAGEYTFYLDSDDGSRLLVGGEQVINHDGTHAMGKAKPGEVQLAAGRHPIELYYFNESGSQGLRLEYQGPGVSRTIVPADKLSRSDALRGPGGDGLIAHWSMEQTQGDAISDASKRGYHAPLTGGADMRQGKVGLAMSFDGERFATINDGAGLPLSGSDFTLTAWLRATPKASGGGEQGVLLARVPKAGWGAGATGAIAWAMHDGKPTLTLGDGKQVASKARVDDGQWHHLAVSYDHSRKRVTMFVNGKADGEAGAVTIGAAQDAVVTLGKGIAGLKHGAALKGKLDEVRIYRRVLSGTELAALALGVPSLEAPVKLPEDSMYIAEGSTWRYLDRGNNLVGHEAPAMNDGTWPQGKAPFGYAGAKAGQATTLQGKGKRAIHWFRKRFDARGVLPDKLILQWLADDGAIVFLNGQAIHRDNAPTGPLSASSVAAKRRTGLTSWKQAVLPASALQRGENVLAVALLQDAPGSIDAAFDARLIGSFDEQRAPVLPEVRDHRGPWKPLRIVKAESQAGAKLTPDESGALLVTGKLAEKDTYTIEAEIDVTRIAAVKLEALPDPSLPGGGPGRAPGGGFVLSRLDVTTPMATDDKGRKIAMGRYVHIAMPRKTSLEIAEVEVFVDGKNIATSGKARQSTTASGGNAGRAIDGNTDGIYNNNSVTHTHNRSGQWWELDLGKEHPVHAIKVWPRTDGNLLGRIRGAKVSLLNAAKEPMSRWVLDFPDKKPMDLAVDVIPFRFSEAQATAWDSGMDASHVAFQRSDNRSTQVLGWAVTESPSQGGASAVFKLAEPWTGPRGSTLRFTLTHQHPFAQHTLGRFRLSVADSTTGAKLAGAKAPPPLPKADAVQPQPRSLSDAPKPWADEGKWYALDLTSTQSTGSAELTQLPDGSVLARGGKPTQNEVYTLIGQTDLKRLAGIRLDMLADRGLPVDGPGRQENVAVNGLELWVAPLDKPNDFKQVELHQGKTSFAQEKSSADYMVDGKANTFWAIRPRFGENHAATLKAKAPPIAERGHHVKVIIRHLRELALGRFKVSLTSAADPHAKLGPPTAERRPLYTAGFMPIAKYEKLDGEKRQLKVDQDGVVTADGAGANLSYTLEASTPIQRVTGMRIEVFIPEDNKRKFLLRGLSVTASPVDGKGAPQKLTLQSPRADYEGKRFTMASAIKGSPGWSNDGQTGGDRVAAVSFANAPSYPGGTRLKIEMKQLVPFDSFRVSLTGADNAASLPLKDAALAPIQQAKADDKPKIDPNQRVWHFNLGGVDYEDTNGNKWLEAKPYVAGGHGYVGGSGKDVPYVNKEDDPLHGRIIEGIEAFKMTLPQGRYRVTLVFIEPTEKEKGKRIFAIKVQGRTVTPGLDILERLRGQRGVHGLTIDRITVNDKGLTVSFETVGKLKPAVLAAIRVEKR